MISLFGSAISSTAPLLLFGIPIVVTVLVSAYRNRGSTRQGVVSTLFLLRNLPQRLTARRRFTPPLQFWIELLALSALSLAAAGLLLLDSGTRVAIVIDTSLSMQAPASDSSTRIESAKSVALADVARAAAATRFYPFSANAALTPLSTTSVGAAKAAALISSLSATPAEDHLQSQITSLLNSQAYDSVWVYTDYGFNSAEVSPRLRVASVAQGSLSLPTSNIWIRSAELLRDDKSTMLGVSLEVAGGAKASVAVGATCYEIGANDTPLPTDIPEVVAEVSPAVLTKLQLGPIRAPWSYCHVKARSRSPNLIDPIPADNDAWITNSDSEIRANLISTFSPEQLQIESLAGVRVSSIPERSLDSEASIVHRAPIPSSQNGPMLVVYPPPGDIPWGGSVRAATTERFEITRWSSSHPLLRYVDPTLLTIPTSQIIECPPSATPIITTTAGTVACAGERQGKQYAVIGFELFPFDGSKNPTLSILTLNLFKWLFKAPSQIQGLHPLEPFVLEPSVTAVRMIAPKRAGIDVAPNRSVAPEYAGVLAFTEGPSQKAVLRAVNIFSAQESALLSPPTLNLDTSSIPARTTDKESIDLTPWFATLALLVLVADLLRRIVFKTRWSRL